MIKPKNWGDFQHYNGRLPPWIKLHRKLLDDYEFACLPVASRALAPMLWLIASEFYAGEITLASNALAFRLRMSLDEFSAALAPLVQGGFFIEGGHVAECKQDASTLPAQREQDACLEKEREKEEEEESDIGAVAVATRPARKQRASKALASESDFERFKAAYPKRTGANPWVPAGKLFAAAVKGGEDAQNIITGAVMYADELRRTGKLGSEHVAQAKTWLSQQRWKDYPEQLAAGLEPLKAEERATPAGRFYAKAESPQLRAWDEHGRKHMGRSFPRDKAGGWEFPSEWPPGHEPDHEITHQRSNAGESAPRKPITAEQLAELTAGL